jgi:signal transduction histidine kinase
VSSPALAMRPGMTVTRTPRLGALWVIGCAGCVAAVSTVALALASEGPPDPLVRAISVAAIMLSYILAGLVAWRRRPESRFGPLMVAAGFAAFFSHLSWTSLALPFAIDVPFTIGRIASLLPPVLFLHVFLAFPSGRLQSGLERALVAAAYITAVGLNLVVMMLSDLDPHNLIGVTTAPEAALLLRRAELVALSASSLAGFAVLAARRRGGGRPLRHSLDLLIDAFGIALVAISVLLIASIFEPAEMETIRRAAYAVIGIAPFAFLFALLRARLARTGLGDLFVELRSDLQPAALRAALSRALGDPSLTLAYWLPQFRSWADLDGRALALPAAGSGRTTTLIEREGAHVAALLHDPALTDEPELLDAVTAAAGIALEHGRLQVELKARVEELRGSRLRILDAGQEERKRLERNLHDGAQQRLVALSLELSLLEERLASDPDTKAQIGQARGEIAASLEELREIARGLHPAVVSAHGLAVALERLATRAPVPISLTVEVGGRLPEAPEVAVYYLVAEALANVGKYAQASSVSVQVSRSNGQVVVEIADDGIGGADTEQGSGLRGLADRVEALDGSLRVWSPSGGGTRVRAEIPCAR